MSDQGVHCLLIRISIRKRIKMGKNTLDAPKIGNGLMKLIRMDKSTGRSRVKQTNMHVSFHYGIKNNVISFFPMLPCKHMLP